MILFRRQRRAAVWTVACLSTLVSLGGARSLAWDEGGLAVNTPVALATPEFRVVLNIPAMRLTLLRDGEVYRNYPVAVGKPATPTVTGEFQIINEVVNPTWYPRGKKPVPPGPENPIGTRWLGLSLPEYGIHGTNAPWSIGQEVSNGCVRMWNLAVEDLAGLIGGGTRVSITYETIEVERVTRTETDAGASRLDAGRPLAWRVAVHPDVYQRKTTSVASLTEKLRAAGVEAPLDGNALEALLAAGAGQAIPVPTVTTAALNGRVFQSPILFRDGVAMVSLLESGELAGVPLTASGGDFVLSARGDAIEGVEELSGGVPYAPAWRIGRALRLRARYDSGVDRVYLEAPPVLWEGEAAGFCAAWLDGEFKVPVGRLASMAGRSDGLELTGDRFVSPGEAASLLGLELLPTDPALGDLAPISFRSRRAAPEPERAPEPQPEPEPEREPHRRADP